MRRVQPGVSPSLGSARGSAHVTSPVTAFAQYGLPVDRDIFFSQPGLSAGEAAEELAGFTRGEASSFCDGDAGNLGARASLGVRARVLPGSASGEAAGASGSVLEISPASDTQ